MSSSARVQKLAVDPMEIKKKDTVSMTHDDHHMKGNVGDPVKMMIHGKIEGVHEDEYGRRVSVAVHKIEHQGDKK